MFMVDLVRDVCRAWIEKGSRKQKIHFHNKISIFIWHSLESDIQEWKSIFKMDMNDITKSKSKVYTYTSRATQVWWGWMEEKKRDRFHKENCCFKYLKKIFYVDGRIAIRIGHRLWMVHQASSECYFSHLSLTHAEREEGKSFWEAEKLHYFLVSGIFFNLRW